MIVFDKPNDSAELLAAKLRVRDSSTAVSAAQKALTIAKMHEGRMRFELLLVADRLTESGIYTYHNGPIGVLVPLPDFPYAALRPYKKDGTLSDRTVSLYGSTVESLTQCEAPKPAEPAPILGAKSRAPRVRKLKVFAGNYDGTREAAVAATSSTAAQKALGTNATQMKNFFRERDLADLHFTDVVAQPGIVFFRPLSIGAGPMEPFKQRALRN